MRSVFHILLAVCLVWCGLHAAEPVRPGTDGPVLVADADCDSEVEDGKHSSQPHHHHCPIAPDPGSDRAVERFAPPPMVFARQPVPLESRSRAPPVEPPLA